VWETWRKRLSADSICLKPERSVAQICLTQTGKKQTVIPRVNHETGFCMANSLDAMPGKGGS